MRHPGIKNVKWVPYNEHDELVRAMEQIDQLQAVVDAAVIYIHSINEGHHGPLPAGTTAKRLKNLHEEVAAFEEKDL